MSDGNSRGRSQPQASTADQQQEVFFSRVARVATAVATAPEWVRQ